MLMMIGPGGTSKGTAIRLIELLLGGDDASHDVRSPAQLAGQFAMSGLRGKRLLIVSDMPARPTRGQMQGQFDAGMATIKNLTGGDKVDVEVKYQTANRRRLDVAVIVASNFEPTWMVSSEDATAWARRLLAFRFDKQHSGTVKRYERNVLGPELPRIAAHCLTVYAQALRDAGGSLSARDLRSEVMRDRIDDIVNAARGKAGEFIADNLIVDAHGHVTREELSEAYADFLKIPPDKQLSQAQVKQLFATLLEMHAGAKSGRQVINGKRERLFTGVRFEDEQEMFS